MLKSKGSRKKTDFLRSGSALTVSKCENFDPLKRAQNSVFVPKTPDFLHTQENSQKADRKGGGGFPYSQPDRIILDFFTTPPNQRQAYREEET